MKLIDKFLKDNPGFTENPSSGELVSVAISGGRIGFHKEFNEWYVFMNESREILEPFIDRDSAINAFISKTLYHQQ